MTLHWSRGVKYAQMGLCPYAGPAVSQLEAATVFLEAHRGAVTLLTLDIGANDVLPCADARTGRINQPCIEVGVVRASRATCHTSWRRSGRRWAPACLSSP